MEKNVKKSKKKFNFLKIIHLDKLPNPDTAHPLVELSNV